RGGLIVRGEQVVGSELIGQSFVSPAYVHGRPSAAGSDGYDPMASGGSNLAPTSRRLRDRVAVDVARLQSENPDAREPIPADLVTASGSGLDPDVSPAAARWQAPRIAVARGVPLAAVEAVIAAHVVPRVFGFLGEPRVNVLRLNLALDTRFGLPRAGR
ncbi:MAG: potassium-transporting ATPase subunit KdpC, partial [Candidatus Eiseniibacteriota bacterium]